MLNLIFPVKVEQSCLVHVMVYNVEYYIPMKKVLNLIGFLQVSHSDWVTDGVLDVHLFNPVVGVLCICKNASVRACA